LTARKTYGNTHFSTPFHRRFSGSGMFIKKKSSIAKHTYPIMKNITENYFCPRRRHIASITNLTRCGGLLNARNSLISFLFKESSAFVAASIAGIAASRSLWASSAKICVSAAFA
jgi:hypothetical protein